MYVEYGQKLGLDPVEYFNKISNYNELRGRDLVYVKVGFLLKKWTKMLVLWIIKNLWEFIKNAFNV